VESGADRLARLRHVGRLHELLLRHAGRSRRRVGRRPGALPALRATAHLARVRRGRFFHGVTDDPAVARHAEKGMLNGVTRIVGEVSIRVHPFDATPLWERGVRLANDLAAFPSLHEAMTVLFVFILWRRARWWLRIPLVLYPLAMAFALVYSGEHYVIDLVGSVALAVAVRIAEPKLTRRVTEACARRRRPADADVVLETS
jgi:membrane-associated phospholipid phosphatase